MLILNDLIEFAKPVLVIIAFFICAYYTGDLFFFGDNSHLNNLYVKNIVLGSIVLVPLIGCYFGIKYYVTELMLRLKQIENKKGKT